jgi:hypothetical protein
MARIVADVPCAREAPMRLTRHGRAAQHDDEVRDLTQTDRH